MEFSRENFQASDSEIFTDSDANSDEEFQQIKKRKLDTSSVVLPPGFLEPLQQPTPIPPHAGITRRQRRRQKRRKTRIPSPPSPTPTLTQQPPVHGCCKQFWKAGDYEIPPTSALTTTGSLDHARVHPKFLHTNATSHKWALGAFAELLDNAFDEIPHGATFARVDVIENKKDGSKMVYVQDNGGGMSAATLRHCMSLGYSVKSKSGNTIGQYGNGFKTSTMRLGADVIVFTRCKGKDGNTPTQSIGMLSYNFLMSTRKDDVVVPFLDYKKSEKENKWEPLMKSSIDGWTENLELILQWSPFSSEAELLEQFGTMESQGTRVVMYSLWEDEQGFLELDFDADPKDIQLRGVNRDEAKIEMAKKYPSSRHYLTYQHSLRSYASILYLRVPSKFRIVLRGKLVEHHKVVDDMILSIHQSYKPTEGVGDSKDVVPITLGFVKDAKEHIEVQGFNVYHKNRLIKPFWQVWKTTGSDGRGIIGVLEANFIEPAHDKQGFETTPLLERLRCKLVQIQRNYWRENSHEVGYLDKRTKKRSQTYSEILAEENSATPKVTDVQDNSLKPTIVTKNRLREMFKPNLFPYQQNRKIPISKVAKFQDHPLELSATAPASFCNKRLIDMTHAEPLGEDQHNNKILKSKPVTRVQEYSPDPPAFLSNKRNSDISQIQPMPYVPEDGSKSKEEYSSQYALLLAESNLLKEKFSKLEESEKLREKEMADTMKEKDQKILELEVERDKAITLYGKEKNVLKERFSKLEESKKLIQIELGDKLKEKDQKIQELEVERVKAITRYCEENKILKEEFSKLEESKKLIQKEMDDKVKEKDQKIKELEVERDKAITLYCDDKIQRDIDEANLKKKINETNADVYDLQNKLHEANNDIYSLQKKLWEAKSDVYNLKKKLQEANGEPYDLQRRIRATSVVKRE